MREEIISVIAPFIKLNPAQINEHTPIGRRAVASSIILHRMYARLSKAGYPVTDYWGIETLGELLARFSSGGGSISIAVSSSEKQSEQVSGTQHDSLSIGIDAQPVAEFKEVPDFRTDAFYTMNFNSSEISWCLLQNRPLLSFAGLFAAKEAMVKADNRYINTPFHAIEVDHLLSGKPVAKGFRLSITHTDEMAIAVAIPNKLLLAEGLEAERNAIPIKNSGRITERMLIGLAVLFSLLALLWSVFGD